MQEPIREELMNELPQEGLPVTDASPLKLRQQTHLPTKRVGFGFISAYAAVYVATSMAVLVPLVLTLALRIQQLDAAGKVGDLALVMAVGGIFVVLAGPFMGRLSDRTTWRLGMRRPFLLTGAILEASGLLMLAVAPALFVVLVSWCLVAIGSTAVLTAANAVLPDQVPQEQRGLVSGVLGMTQGVGLIVGTFLVQAVVGSVLGMFVLPALVALVSVLIFAVILPDRRLDPQQPLPSYNLGEFLHSFWVNPRRYPDFGWAWMGRFLVVMGMVTLTSYQVYYLIDHLHVSPRAVAGLIFLSILISNIALMIASHLSGWFSDKVRRRKPFVLIAALLYALGLLLVALAPTITAFLIAIAMTGIGQGVYMAIDLVLGAAVLPEGGREAGKDMSVFSIASTVPNTVAPAIAPLFLAIGGEGNYTALFLAAALFAFLGALCTQPIKGVH
jgi:MFS family permease